jgi:hypothetical protein
LKRSKGAQGPDIPGFMVVGYRITAVLIG